MREKIFSARSIPVLFFVVAFLSYGLLIPWTGFYWDDWPLAWIAKFLGPAGYLAAFRGFRPFLGPIFFVTTSLIPSNPLLWQILAFIIRIAAGLAVWFALDPIWPNYRRQTLVASLLLVVFPGYSQNWVAFTHINQEWIPFIFYLLSIGFSARALRNPGRAISSTALALLFLIIGLFPTEYFVGLEPLRFLFFWLIVSEETQGFSSRLLQTIKRWWPYLLVWLVDALWLAYFYRSGAYISYGLAGSQSFPTLRALVLGAIDVVWKTGFYTWVQILVLGFHSITAPTTLVSFVLILVTFILLFIYLSRLELSHNNSRAFGLAAIPIGLAGILLGRIPSFAAGLPLTLQSSFDRFMISMMVGGTLFIVGAVDVLIRNQRAKTCVFAALIALGIGQQFFNANIYRRDWEGQLAIYWQLAWRIPALKPSTAIITQQMPLDYETDLSMTAPLNWIYAPRVQPPDLPYALIYTEKRLGGIALPSYQPGTVLQLPYRSLTFRGNSSQAIVIYVPPNGCLRVFDPALGDMATYNKFQASLIDAIPLSDPARIIANAPPLVLPSPPFSAEPAHTWCYFYEKGELARQTRDWVQVAELGHAASQAGLNPQDPFEWLPFIEGYARTGDLNSADQISQKAWKDQPRIHTGLCLLWTRVQLDGPSESKSFAAEMLSKLGCGP
jgi:hypothetical protein